MAFFPKFFLDLIQRSTSESSELRIEELVNFHNWVCAQPKIETHVHVEAAVSESFYSMRPIPESWTAKSFPWDRAPFENLRGFIMAWVDLSKSMRQLSDFEQLAEAFVRQRALENIRYTEAYISPADFSFIRERFSIAPEIFDFESIIRAYLRGLKRGLQDHRDLDVRLTVDALWISTNNERQLILQSLKNILKDPQCCDDQGHSYIVAVGLGGQESHQDFNDRVEFIDQVRELGLKVDIHSGEGGDPEVHKKTVSGLRPDRVAHGFSAWTDGFLFEHNLVMCPLSNLLLRTFDGKPDEHPVFECLRRRLPICIGSDDPLLIGNSLALEYTFLHAITGDGLNIFKFTQQNAKERVLKPSALGKLNFNLALS